MLSFLEKSPFFKKPEEISIEKLIKELKSRHKDVDAALIKKAYLFAKERHKGQKRKTGEPYIIHPLNTAHKLVLMGLGESSVIAALLHDLHEDTDTTLEEIQQQFGAHIAHLVDGVSKLGKVKITNESTEEKAIYYQNLRKMFIAMAKDIRVILIRLADRLHNMETLEGHSKEKQERIAKETLEIYAPIANRLGMGEVKGQLEDLAFVYTYPKKYQWLVKTFEKKIETQGKHIEKTKKYLLGLLKNNGINKVVVEGRTKHIYSLYRKLQKNNNDPSKIYDIVAVRVIVNNVHECYQVLGIVHQQWKPLVGRIKDYIATPKPNGYQSLHTTVFALDGQITEIQIRTMEMHKEAEYGIAAHWIYADGKGLTNYMKRFLAPTPEVEMEWVQQLSSWKSVSPNEREKLIKQLRIDYFNDRIFVFTPRGDVKDLPKGATALDLAYSIHTDVGNTAQSAVVNDKDQPLSYSLENGDVVQIVKQKGKHPKSEWLQFVRTEQAKEAIQQWLQQRNETEHEQEGKNRLHSTLVKLTGRSLASISAEQKKLALNKLNIENQKKLFQEIGKGSVEVIQAINELLSPEEVFTKRNILIHKAIDNTTHENSLIVEIKKCCQPNPGEKIAIHSTGPGQATIHTPSCHVAKKIKTTTFWSKEKKSRYYVLLAIEATNKIGLLKNVADILNKLGINIEHITTEKKEKDLNITTITIGIGVSGIRELYDVVKHLSTIPGIKDVQRKEEH